MPYFFVPSTGGGGSGHDPVTIGVSAGGVLAMAGSTQQIVAAGQPAGTPALALFRLASGDLGGIPLGSNLSIGGGTLNASAAGGAAFVFDQPTPAETWTINHNLGFRPTVEVINSGGQEIDAEVIHSTANQTVVTVSPATAGQARLS